MELQNKKILWVKNRFYQETDDSNILVDFNELEIERVLAFQKTHKAFTSTPLYKLDHLAKELNVRAIFAKDESKRFGLNAFKVLGGIYSIAKYIAEELNQPIEQLSFDILKSDKVKSQLGDLTFISATDGNHGRGVAWAARELGYKSVIYMPKGSSEQRLKAIRDEGAVAEIQDVNYDDTVRICAQLAEKNDWIMVQDTAWEGYEKIPLWIMQGYSAIAKEIVDELKINNERIPTHVFLQAGVGSFAAAIAGYLLQVYGENTPKIVIVEPHQANCFYESFISAEGTREFITGSLDTLMAGLACGEPNTKAFELLRNYAIGTVSCTDELAALGMRIYGNPLGVDPKIISGESGAGTLGLLYYLRKYEQDQNILKEMELNEESSILLISTEGDTDTESYKHIVWEGKYALQSEGK